MRLLTKSGTAAAGRGKVPAVVPSRVPLFELAVLVLGFGLCRASVVGALALAGSLEAPGGWGPWSYDQLFLLCGALASLLTCLLAPRLFSSSYGLDRLNAANGVLVLVSACLMALAMAERAQPLLMAAFALCGASSALMQVMWGERFVRHSMYLALVAAPGAAVATAATMMAVPSEGVLALVLAAPVASLLLLCANRGPAGSLVLSLRPRPEDAEVFTGVEGERPDPITNGTFVRLMASIAVFSLVGRCLDSFPADFAGFAVPTFVAEKFPFLAIAAVGVLFVLLVVALGERFDTLFVYRLSLPLMVAGFAVLTLSAERFSVASIATVTVGYEFFDVLFWAVLVGVVRHGGRRPVPVFGWGVCSTYVGMALGTLLSRVCVPPILAGELDFSALSLGCIWVLVVLVVLVLPEGTFSRAGSVAPAGPACAPAGEDTLSRGCSALAARCRLTPREVDVLGLLARGRTLSVVARELGIAEGTARTHMGHIYAKLDVHKQQELIDLVEQAALPRV